ncbi:pyridoxal-phosphate-dependent aminotransferase family protein [Paracoccus jiaweipingae]|uniref:pyridoxal-phosphate-dependent aminotransferase family protein n=1 Tax=unclassified Paracoccus (in: a-proteobacteria) TaxID=2688777 RepID=UPI00379A4CE7
MSFAFGHPALAIPGPSATPDRVLRAMHRAATDIYAGELVQVNARVVAALKRLAGTTGDVAPYIGNGHAGWEAATTNLLNRGDRALVLVNGMFGAGWAAHARALGIEVEELTSPHGQPADPAALASRLADDRDHRIRAVLCTQVDTATSVRNDLPALRAAMGDHPAAFAVDAIASLGCEPLRMDDWGIDLLVSASQKGLMAPPGLAFVWIGPRLKGGTDLVTPYWDWRPRVAAQALWQYWGGTPPVQHIYGMDQALRMLLDDEGLDAAHARHHGLAQAVWAAFDCWSAGHPGLALTVADPAARAWSVTAASIPGATGLRDWATRHMGTTLGLGLGAPDPDNALRIGHMGHLSAQSLLGTLAVVETAMTALNIPHGPGALTAATARLAGLAGA